MSQNMGGVLNRLNRRLLNWQYIEEIEFTNAKVTIYYTSGRIVVIDVYEEARALIDLLEVFPDIYNPKTRLQMKNQLTNQNQQFKTDVSEPKKASNKIQTDMTE